MRRAHLSWLLLGNLALAVGIAVLAPAGAQENRLPPGPGRDAVIAACSDCHGLVALNGKHLDYGAWYAMIGDMMNNGASVSATDRAAIADYLATNFGPPDAAQPAPPAAK
jgi:mono/diheme cytochrome c family protein